MRIGKLSNRSSQIALVSFFLSFLTLSAPVLGAVTVGVHAGDWVQYGNITGSAKEKDFNQTSSLKGTVQSVSGTTVTLTAVTTYTNSSTKTETLTGDIATGSGNLSYVVIPSGLGQGDTFKLNETSQGGSTVTVTINATLTRSYAGVSRTVDKYTYGFSYSYLGVNYAFNITAYWDQATGVLVEIAFSDVISGSCSTYSICSNDSFGFSLTQTSLWGGGIFGGSSSSDLLLYGGIVVVVIVVGAGGYLYMRSRKPKMMPPTTPSTPTSTS
jgi:hypothetical protein